MQYELEEFGIKVILIEPGVVKTNFFENSKPPKNTTSSNSQYSELAKKVSEGFKPMLENNSSSPIHVAQVILKAITYFGPAPSMVQRELIGPYQLLKAGQVDLNAGTITLPLYQGQVKLIMMVNYSAVFLDNLW